MNVFEFCERYQLSLAKARRIAKDQPQWFDATAARLSTRSARPSPTGTGSPRCSCSTNRKPGRPARAWQVRDQGRTAIAALGNPSGQVAPREVAANIMEAAKGEPEAVQILVDWLRSIIPAKPG
jgi:hypothetical protein